MLTEGTEAVLLEKADAEEKVYNWVEAAEIYNQVAKSFLDKNMIERAAKAYKKLGYANASAANTVDTSESYLERTKYAINSYKKAANLFEQSGNNPEELECEAEAFFVKGISAGSIMEVKEAFSKANELFIKANEFYSKGEDQESCARTLNRTAMASSYLFVYCSDPDEIKQVIRKGKEYSEKAWKISKEIGNVKYLVDSLTAETKIFIRDISTIESGLGELPLKIEKYLTLVEDYNDFQDLGMVYTSAGILYCFFGTWDVDQKEYIDKGLLLIEKGLEFARKTRDKSMILFSLTALNIRAIMADKYEYYQKRTLNDLNEMAKLSKIFTGIVWRLLPDEVACRYYLYLALSGFFTPTQRKSYAEKGIKHAIKLFELSSSIPSSSVYGWILTSFHSVLTLLATTKDEQDENAKKMLQLAKQAENFLKTFEGTGIISNICASIYVAHRTLADIAKSDKERIKMLTLAADVYEKNINQAEWSHTGKLGILIRLGRIYEELGILTVDTEKITKAKETFLSLIKETHKRNIPIFRALTYEHIARIEDRLGNHTVSAKNYEKARKTHAESLKTIDYEPLKIRVKEKIDYTHAWNLIEIAKTYHKSENHLKAKNSYKEASKLLKNVQRHDYEAPYCAAWALLEEAEQLSKQEMLEEAIEKYETTGKAFDEAIKTFEKAYKESEEKRVRERIEKLEKVANIRIKYCMARINLEKARILGKQGEHLLAAGKFTLAASQFRNVCTVYKIERERKDLEAIYYLCRAWESMVLAEKYEEPERFAEAANLFIKAGNLFTENKLKLLASGNSAFCQALEYGCRFDESIDVEIKTQLYPKVKLMLRKAADSYRKGGFKGGTNWALATSTHFDATWHLIRADEESDFKIKGDLLGIGSRCLMSAAELFGNAGYKDKEKDVQAQLEMVEREEIIVLSALNTIKQPAISRSTTGIVAPACPLETSESPRLNEVRQFGEEELRVMEERRVRKKYELIYRDLFKEYPKVQKRECRVAIAQISASQTGNILDGFFEMKTMGLMGLREEKVEFIRSKVKSMIEEAHENGANILLFPEMTIDLNYFELLQDISDLAKIYEMYIIPGSYHDQETRRNVSMVIGSDGILWDQEKHIPAIINIGGKRFKEGIEVGTLPRKTIICNTEYGRIAIAICRDFLDMDLRVELKNFEPAVDIILNPAFTPVTADFKAAHFDARRSIYAYCFFANVAEFGDSLIYTPEKERIERTLPAKEEGIIYKDVNIFKLRSERKKWEKEQKKEKSFIQSTR